MFIFFPAVSWLTSRPVYATLSLNRLTRRLRCIFFSPVNLAKIVYPLLNVVDKKQFLLVVANRVTGSRKIRQVYSTEILSNTATIREGNSSEIDSFFTENCTEGHKGLRVITTPSYKRPNSEFSHSEDFNCIL